MNNEKVRKNCYYIAKANTVTINKIYKKGLMSILVVSISINNMVSK